MTPRARARVSIALLAIGLFAAIFSLPAFIVLSPTGPTLLCGPRVPVETFAFYGWWLAVSLFAHFWVICWVSGATVAAASRVVALLHACLGLPTHLLVAVSSRLLYAGKHSELIPVPAVIVGTVVAGAGLLAISIWLPRIACFSAVTVRGPFRITVAAVALTVFVVALIAFTELAGVVLCI